MNLADMDYFAGLTGREFDVLSLTDKLLIPTASVTRFPLLPPLLYLF
jgi:hypothetical protein